MKASSIFLIPSTLLMHIAYMDVTEEVEEELVRLFPDYPNDRPSTLDWSGLGVIAGRQDDVLVQQVVDDQENVHSNIIGSKESNVVDTYLNESIPVGKCSKQPTSGQFEADCRTQPQSNDIMSIKYQLNDTILTQHQSLDAKPTQNQSVSPSNDTMSTKPQSNDAIPIAAEESTLIQPVDDWDTVRLWIAARQAKSIRQAVWDEVEYTCSAGISINKTLAKICSALHKPNQQTILLPNHVLNFLRALPIDKIR
jgi:hypothetical protein